MELSEIEARTRSGVDFAESKRMNAQSTASGNWEREVSDKGAENVHVFGCLVASLHGIYASRYAFQWLCSNSQPRLLFFVRLRWPSIYFSPASAEPELERRYFDAWEVRCENRLANRLQTRILSVDSQAIERKR